MVRFKCTAVIMLISFLLFYVVRNFIPTNDRMGNIFVQFCLANAKSLESATA